MLPDKALRWLIAVFMSTLGVFFSTLTEAWHWDLPTEAILTTLSTLELFLSAIFGISKGYLRPKRKVRERLVKISN